MARTMYAGRMFDAIALGASPATATSDPVRMDAAEAMSIHSQVVDTAGTINITYTIELSSNSTGPWVASNTSIAAHTPSLDITGFSPESAKWIRLIVTNNDATAITNLTSVLSIQEG
jgi:uncharacterized iron-regulated membrane protein